MTRSGTCFLLLSPAIATAQARPAAQTTPLATSSTAVYFLQDTSSIAVDLAGGQFITFEWPGFNSPSVTETSFAPAGADVLTLPGEPPIIVGYDRNGLRDTNVLSDEVFAENVTSYLRSVAPDVDGDGRDDLLHDRELVLTRNDGFVVVPLPAPEREDKPFALPDVTGDGLGDLILVEHDVTPWPYYDIYGASTARLYPGTPTGYADEPLWTLDFLDGLWSVIAIQADDDPELELFGVVAGLNLFEWTPLSATGFRFDEVHTANPDAHWVTDLPGFGSMSPYGTGDVHAIGDLDHDGLDEVLVPTVTTDPEQPSYQVLSGALDYDIEQPLVTFWLEGPRNLEYANATTADIDGDGELDLIAASWNTNVGYLHVWESPFLPQPGPTGDTGAPTTTSGATAPTADTGPPDLTTATTTPTPAPSEDPKACGCRSAPSGSGALLLTLLVPFARRRSRRPRTSRRRAPPPATKT